MARMSQKDTIQKTYRFEKQQAKDMEYLAKCVGRTQNEILNYGMSKLLFENREYFMEEEYVERCRNLLIRMRDYNEEGQMKLGGIELVFKRTKEAHMPCHMVAYNKYEELIYCTDSSVLLNDEDNVKIFLEEVRGWIRKYMDSDADDVLEYFRQRFFDI